jgi:hypothetical protein
MSTKIQPKRGILGTKCPREFTYFVHENSNFMSTRILLPVFITLLGKLLGGFLGVSWKRSENRRFTPVSLLF